MGKCLFMRKGETHSAPIAGIMLSDIAEGSVVKLTENGIPAEFYVACHNYESTLNGTGRTLLIRKHLCEQNVVWNQNSNGVATNSFYANSALDKWLNETYKPLLDTTVQELAGTTKFYYTSSNTGVSVLSRMIFTLSFTEFGYSATGVPSEGFMLPTAEMLKIATIKDGTATSQFTRTAVSNGSKIYTIQGYDGNAALSSVGSSMLPRPALTLPDDTIFNAETLMIQGVNAFKDITPVMTSATTPSGYEVTTSGNNDTRVGYKAFDGVHSSTNVWHSTAGVPQWIQMKFPESITVNRFSIQNPMADSYGTAGPVDFILQGSNDGVNFVNLGSYTDNDITAEKVNFFDVKNQSVYQYYRIYITKSGYVWNNTQYVVISEIKFYVGVA